MTGRTRPPAVPLDQGHQPGTGQDLISSTGGDIRRFWSAYAVSALGSGIGAGALPLVAILLLDASDWQVSLLAVLGGLAGVAMAVPMGPWIEFHHKRPTLITADLIRFAALASIPAAAWLDVLSYGQLCTVAVLQTAAMIMSNAASQPYLKALVPACERARVNSRLETTTWTTSALGPPIGGLLVSATSPVASIGIDAVSYLLAAAGLRRIRQPEPPPPKSGGRRQWLADTAAGWQCILAHRTLRHLFFNALLFGGCIMASSPLIAVYLLRELHFNALEYGIALVCPAPQA